MTEKDLMEKALSAYGLDRQAICRRRSVQAPPACRKENPT